MHISIDISVSLSLYKYKYIYIYIHRHREDEGVVHDELRGHLVERDRHLDAAVHEEDEKEPETCEGPDHLGGITCLTLLV